MKINWIKNVINNYCEENGVIKYVQSYLFDNPTQL